MPWEALQQWFASPTHQLIVVGGRGRTNLADLLLGAKTERVARLAKIPVAIVKAEAAES